MADKNSTVFTMNELVAIHAALESQIKDCEKYLTDSSLTIDAKLQLMQTLTHSKSALSRLDIIFDSHGYCPTNNLP